MSNSIVDTPQQYDGFGLGRIGHEDPRDLNFLMSAVMEEQPVEVPLLPYRYYTTGPIMDQGATPMCEEFSHNQWLSSFPVRNNRVEPTGTLYREAQAVDPWAGTQHDGTTTRAMMKVLQSRGLVGNYVWAFDAAPLREWILSNRGPVVVGTWWYQSMFYPDVKTGLITVDTSRPAGGHAYLISGYNDKTKLFRVTNSWGTGWAQRGRAWLKYDDLNRLIQNQGEACTAVENLVR